MKAPPKSSQLTKHRLINIWVIYLDDDGKGCGYIKNKMEQTFLPLAERTELIRKFTDEEFLALYYSKLSDGEIARAFGCSTTSAKRRRYKYGLIAHYDGPNGRILNPKRLLELYKEFSKKDWEMIKKRMIKYHHDYGQSEYGRKKNLDRKIKWRVMRRQLGLPVT